MTNTRLIPLGSSGTGISTTVRLVNFEAGLPLLIRQYIDRVKTAGGEIVNRECLIQRINSLFNTNLIIQSYIVRVENSGGEIINQACLSSRYILLTEINIS
jgi:hypothetical protein